MPTLLRRRSTFLGGAALAAVALVLAPAAGASATPNAARAAAPGPEASDVITGPLQNSVKSTYLGLNGSNDWIDTATRPGKVTYPAPGKTAPVSIDGRCAAITNRPTEGTLSTIPVGDGSKCLRFAAVVTSEGFFTFQVDHPGALSQGHYLGDGNRGGVQDLIATSPDVLYKLPEEPAGSASLSGAAQDVDGNGRIDAGDRVVWSAELQDTGNVRLRDLTLSLSNGVPMSCDPTFVDAGASVTCVSDPQVLTQSDIDSGRVAATLATTAVTPSGAPFSFADSAANVELPAAGAGRTSTTVTGAITEAGQKLEVTSTLRNEGNVTLSDLTATVNGEPIALTVHSLAPGAVTEHTFEHEVTQAEFDAGRIDFRTEAAGTTPSGTTVQLAASSDGKDFERSSEISASLVATVKGDGGVGDDVRLALRVTNTGNASVQDLAATFDGGDGFTASCPSAPLAPGATVDCAVTGTHALTQADVDAGSVSFRAVVRAVDVAGAAIDTAATATQATVAQAPAVSATIVPELQSGGSSPAPGDVVSLALRVSNVGNVTLHDLAGTIADRSGLAVDCGTGSLAPGADSDCRVAGYVLTQADIDRGEVRFGAEVEAVGPKGQRVDASDDATLTVDRRQGLVATASAALASGDGAAPRAGDHVELGVEVRNSGNTTLRDLGASVTGHQLAVDCASAPVAPGASITCTIADHVLTQSEVDAGSVDFEVRVRGTGPGGARAEASDSVAVELARVPAIAITATSVLDANEHEVPLAGDTATVAMTIRNTGNVTVTGVRGSVEHRPGLEVDCPSDELAPGRSVTCNASGYRLAQADVDAGAVRFDVKTAATGADRQRVEATAETTLSIVRAPAISATATATLDDTGHAHPSAGDAASIRLSVENTGNTTVRDLAATVEDATGMVTACDEGALAPGGSAECTITGYALTQADVDAGSVRFAITVTATGADGKSVASSVTAGIDIERAADLDAVVTAHLAESDHRVPRAGDHVALGISAKNTGNVTLRDAHAEFVELADVPVTCGADAITPGGTVECAAPEYVLTQADVERGQVIVAGVLSATGADGTTASDRDVVRVGLRAESGLDVTAQPLLRDRDGRFVPLAEDRVLRPGDELRVQYSVVNTGNLAVSDLQRADDVPVMEFDRTRLEPGDRATATTTAAHTVTEAEGAAGSVVLVGRVKGQVVRADGDADAVTGGITTGQTGSPDQSGVATETAGSVVAASKPVWVFSDVVRTTLRAEPIPATPAPIELAFTGSQIAQVALPAGIVLLLAGTVLLVWVRRRRTEVDAARHRR